MKCNRNVSKKVAIALTVLMTASTLGAIPAYADDSESVNEGFVVDGATLTLSDNVDTAITQLTDRFGKYADFSVKDSPYITNGKILVIKFKSGTNFTDAMQENLVDDMIKPAWEATPYGAGYSVSYAANVDTSKDTEEDTRLKAYGKQKMYELFDKYPMLTSLMGDISDSDMDYVIEQLYNQLTENRTKHITEDDIDSYVADIETQAQALLTSDSLFGFEVDDDNTSTSDAPVTPYADGIKWLEDTVSPEVVGGGNEDAHPPKLSADEREDTYLYLCDAIKDLYKGTCFESYTSVALQDLKDAYEDDYSYRDNSDLWSFYDSVRKNTVLSYIQEQSELSASFESDALRILRMKPDNEAYLEAKFDAEQLTSNYAEFLNSYDPTLKADAVRTTWFLVALAGELHPVSDIKGIASDLESRAQSWYNEQESAEDTSETTETDSSRRLSREEAEAIFLEDLAPCGLDYIAASSDYDETETYYCPEFIYDSFYQAIFYTLRPKYTLTAKGAHAYAVDIKAAVDATEADIKTADNKYKITGYYWARHDKGIALVILQDEGAVELDETFIESIATNWYGPIWIVPDVKGYINGVDFNVNIADAASAPLDTTLDTDTEETDAGSTVTVDTSTLEGVIDTSLMSPQELENYINAMVAASLASTTKTTDTPVITTGDTTNNGAWKDSPKTVETQAAGLFWLLGVLGTIGLGTFGTIYFIRRRK